MTAIIYDETPCELGEGPLWHPLRDQLFWFDITGKSLNYRQGGNLRFWAFDEYVSAAGWLDHDSLLVASASALLSIDITCGARSKVVDLEADNPATRSNDGRADPWGGFWIGTMGINAEIDAGAIYRLFRGELRQLYVPVTIPNAICFSPDRQYAYFADTAKAIIWRQSLHFNNGWPIGDPEVFINFTGTKIYPDGAVCDSQGYLWNAQWGAAKLACYSPEGEFVREIKLPTDHITCPAFGGDEMKTLFITSASQGLSAKKRALQSGAGKTFMAYVDVPGQKEFRVML